MHDWHLADRVLHIERRPLVMGIVNVTPDSFSDGGLFAAAEAAIEHGLNLAGEGADLLDIGGESTRPGAEPVALEEELRRVLPVVQALAARTHVPLSIDTSKAEVARACLAAGVHVVNDVTGLRGDTDMPAVVKAGGAGVILIHMQGTPQTMQRAPRYTDVVGEIAQFFEERLHAMAERGIAAERIVLDPGIGFGKTTQHNLEILRRLGEFQRLGRPVCLGVSRKAFVGRILKHRPTDRRLAGSLAAVCFAVGCHAVQIIRAHDVQETRDAVTTFLAIRDGTDGPDQATGQPAPGE
jgi:dihydropteroate synthase